MIDERYNVDEQAYEEVNASDITYEKFVVLSKKELLNFCKVVEPLTKYSIDEYGRSVFIRCVGDEGMEFCYRNDPYKIVFKGTNRSGRRIADFDLSFGVLKKLLTISDASLVFVETDEGLSLSVCSSLIPLESHRLLSSQYEFKRVEGFQPFAKAEGAYAFRRVGAVLSLTDRASEKVAVVKDGAITFSTVTFTTRVKSPFAHEEEFIVFKQTSDVLGMITEIATSIGYYQEGSMLYICTEGAYCELPVGSRERVREFLSPTTMNLLRFTPNIRIVNDNLLRVISTVNSLEFLSNMVGIECDARELRLIVSNVSHSRTSTFRYDIAEGRPEVTERLTVSTGVLRLFLSLVGADVCFSVNPNGIGIKNEYGVFLLRRS